MISILAALAFCLSFLGLHELILRGKHTKNLVSITPTWYMGYTYAIFILLNTLIFFLSTAISPIFSYLALIGLLGFAAVIKKYTHVLYLSAGTILMLYALPLAEADSIGYVLPMADNALAYQTAGLWLTDNIRSIVRFWGIPAQVGNLLVLSNNAIHTLEIVTFIPLLVLGEFLWNLWQQHSKFIRVGLLITVFSSMALFNSLFTLKDDLPFAILALITMQYLLVVTTYNWRYYLLLLGLFISVILLKGSYPLVFLGLTLIILFSKVPLKIKARQFLLMPLAIVLVLALHFQRTVLILDYPQGVKPVLAVLTGMSPSEAGFTLETQAPTAAKDMASYELSTTEQNILLPHQSKPQFFRETTITSYLLTWNYDRIQRSQQANIPGINLFIYGYSGFGLLVILGLLGTFGYAQLKHYILPFLAMSTIFVLAVSHNFNQYRYLYLPVLILIMGIGFIPNVWLRYLGLTYVLIHNLVMLTLFFASAPIQSALKFLADHERPAYALEVISLLPPLNYSITPQTLDEVKPFVVAGGQFSPQFLFTDRSRTPFVETSLNVNILNRILPEFKTPTVIIPSTWQLGYTFKPDLIKTHTFMLDLGFENVERYNNTPIYVYTIKRTPLKN